MIAIVGGGIAGLAAAYDLAVHGVPFVLFEASERLGGLVHTLRVDGFTIEAGADSMLVQKRAGIELCEELGLGPRLISMQEREAYVLDRGCLHPLPSGSMFGIPGRWTDLARYSLLPPFARARIALEPFVPPRRSADDESVASFFRRRLGQAAVDRLAAPLLGGIHAGDVERLSLKALFPRLAEAERTGGLLRWVRRRARTEGGAFRSLASGMGELVEAIARRLPPESVRRRAPVVALGRRDRTWAVTTTEGTSSVDAVILACPAHTARQLLAPIDALAADLCAQTRYVSTASIAVGWPRAAVRHPLRGSGFVVARASTAARITACTWVTSKWPGRAPADCVLLRAYVGGTHDPAAVDLSDADLLEIAVRELSAILSIRGTPVISRIARWRDAGAQHEVGHLARMQQLAARLAGHPGLYVTGSGFRAIGIPDCIADGRTVARTAAHGTGRTMDDRSIDDRSMDDRAIDDRPGR